MILSFVPRGLACVALVLLGVVPSAAQNSGRFNLGAGAAIQRDDAKETLLGFRVDAGVPIGGRLLAVGQVDVTRQFDKHYDTTNILGGVRLAAGGRISVFGQFLAGVNRSRGIQSMAYAPGGGVDVWIARHLAIRAQADFPWLRYKGISFRHQWYTIGAVISFSE